MSAYDPTIPQNLPPPKIIVTSIQNNFFEYDAKFSENHVPMNSSNQGKHENVIFQEQTLDPEIDNIFDALYSKSVVSNSSTSQQLFLRIPEFLPNDLPNLPQQLTFNVVNTGGTDYFQSFLPGGYVFYFGFITNLSNPVPATITLTPAPTSILCAIATANNMTIAGTPIPVDVSVNVIANNKFIIDSFLAPTLASYRFSWVAIAKQ